MPKKETKNMLVRAVDIDSWERIDRYCRQRGLKRREFLERAIDHFEGEAGGRISVEQSTRARGDEILANIKAYELVISLKKKIDKIRNDIKVMNDESIEMNMWKIIFLSGIMPFLNLIGREPKGGTYPTLVEVTSSPFCAFMFTFCEIQLSAILR